MEDDRSDRTRSIGSDAPADPRRGTFDEGSEVELTRLRPQPSEDEAESLVGVLLGRPAAGSPLRIQVGAKRVFVTSPINSLASLGPALLQACTANSVYRLKPRSAAAAARPAGHRATPKNLLARLLTLHTIGVARKGRSRHVAACEATGLVSAPVPLANPDEPFGPGACIHVAWTRDGKREELGLAQLLDGPEVGEELRLVLEQGPTLATTAVRTLRRVGPDAIELETTNTTYHLRLATEAKPDPPSA